MCDLFKRDPLWCPQRGTWNCWPSPPQHLWYWWDMHTPSLFQDHYNIIEFAEVEGEVVVLAPAGKFLHLHSVGLFVMQTRMVVTSANVWWCWSCLTELGGGLSTQPCFMPVSRISKEEVLATDCYQPELTCQKVEYPVADRGMQSEIDKLQDEFGWNDGVECCNAQQ